MFIEKLVEMVVGIEFSESLKIGRKVNSFVYILDFEFLILYSLFIFYIVRKMIFFDIVLFIF